MSREALFLPMGWDNEKRINLLKEGPELPDEIAQPKQRYYNVYVIQKCSLMFRYIRVVLMKGPTA